MSNQYNKDFNSIKNVIETAFICQAEPLSLKDIKSLFSESDNVDRNLILEIINSLKNDYKNKGIELVKVNSGYRIQSKIEQKPYLQNLNTDKKINYSKGFIETLAIIAYRQPITKAEIEDIRGVSINSSSLKLIKEKEWIQVLGHKDIPGRPILWGTTKTFLNDFNLKSLEDLPSINLDVVSENKGQIDLNLEEP